MNKIKCKKILQIISLIVVLFIINYIILITITSNNVKFNSVQSTLLNTNVNITISNVNSDEKIIMNNERHLLNGVENKLHLNDILISVKTTKKFHSTRLEIILKTWWNMAKDQTYFFTDSDDLYYKERTNGHLINTNCTSSHNRKALCCKMSVEFDTFIQSNKSWFCHFDDDNYVNIPRLVNVLRNYDYKQDWYLGKPSLRSPLEIMSYDDPRQKLSFWFATGGAGFCISRALAMKMVPIASNGQFINIGEKIRLPDDVTIGYIIEYVLRKKLTVIEQFHSHLEPMKFINKDLLSDQISFSYSKYGSEMNVITLNDGFEKKLDPTRFLSLHCNLFPKFNYCQNYINDKK